MPNKLIPAWFPTKEYIAKTNIAKAMNELNFASYYDFHRFSVDNYEEFWAYTIKKLDISFYEPYQKICDLSNGIAHPAWLTKAKLNIADNCFHADKDKIAIIYQKENGSLEEISYQKLNQLSNQIANSLIAQGFTKGDPIAIYMPMHVYAVAIYLGIIKAGCVVVSIASSFAAEEIALRMKITKTKAIFTQDAQNRNKKQLPLYNKVVAANAPAAIVINTQTDKNIILRDQDIQWEKFLIADDQFKSIACESEDSSNILFSSGTTGEPKAIIWTHTTPIKCAADAFYHHDLKSNDILAWPSDLGWMMGPWLIYAGLINKATIALFEGAPITKSFGQFIQDAKVSILGLVPSLVASWRSSQCMEGLDWQSIKLFISSGECSNPDDMLYLMSLAKEKPIIEYCGGTEIGGAYITSTLVQPNIPATFTTPALGLDFVMLDEMGHECDNGEVAIIPPSIGLSNNLLNRDHFSVYYANMPTTKDGKILRRHGDQIEKFMITVEPPVPVTETSKLTSNSTSTATFYGYRALGRVDDTMNLGGIKTSSAEIERTLTPMHELKETAAIAVNPQKGGPSLLIIYAVLNSSSLGNDKNILQTKMQQVIKTNLNPLFKIHDIVLVDALPRTASNKIMRRVLRDQYSKS